jgi:hypothetical protein
MNLVYLYLRVTTWIKNIYHYIIDSVTDTVSVDIYHNDTHTNILYRYYLLKSLYVLLNITKLIYFFDNFINNLCKLNPKTLIQCKKNDRIIILETDNLLTLIQDNNYRGDNQLTEGVYLTFSLNDDVCLKEYLIKYRDPSKQYDHTLKNIILLNKIDTDDNTTINITKYHDYKFITNKLQYNDYADLHITDLLEL